MGDLAKHAAAQQGIEGSALDINNIADSPMGNPVTKPSRATHRGAHGVSLDVSGVLGERSLDHANMIAFGLGNAYEVSAVKAPTRLRAE